MMFLKYLSPLVFLIEATALSGQSIAPENAPFVQGKALEFAYSGGTGAATDWVGIYRRGQTPGAVASTVWQYIPGASGKARFEGSLDTGRYDVHLFCCDGYKILASHLNFQVGAARLRSRLTHYKSSDTLRFSAFNVASGDRFFVYKAADFANGALQPGAVAIAEKIFANAANSSTVSLPPALPPAQYAGVLRSAAGVVLGFDGFEIKPAPILPPVVTRLGLGSCSSQNAPQPVLGHVLKHGIEAFIYAGDNAYIDTYDPAALRAGYESWLTKRAEFQNLRASVPLFATWDDHDYGCCDEDKDYPIKTQSQQIFLDFFEEPANSPRRTQAGIYTAYKIGPTGQKLQIILLDTRYFLDNKRPDNGCGQNDYCPWAGPADVNKTMLGPAQWQWLKNTLLEPADLRMIVTSVQFSSSYHGFEGWSLFPYERRRMQELIRETRAEHVFFVSGDMHYSEVSKLDNAVGLYPLYDFTASGINQGWPPENNTNRVEGKAYRDPNVGLLDIDWAGRRMTFSALDVQNTTRFSHTVLFNELEFKAVSTKTPDPDAGLRLQQTPCPGHGAARFVLSEKTGGTAFLFNTAGQLARQTTVRNADTFEMDGLAPGFYVVKFRTEHGQSAAGRVFVEK
jgi:alkaline phosphatase D